MPALPYSDHDFYESDWGGNEAAYNAAKAMFEQKRAAKGEALIKLYAVTDGVALSKTLRLSWFSRPANESGSERSRGWTVRETPSFAFSTRVRPK